MKNKQFSESSHAGRWSKTLCTDTFKAMVVIVTVLTVSACGSGGGGSPAATDVAVTGATTAGATTGGTSSSSRLAGTWVQCLDGLRTSYTMTDSRYGRDIAYFESEDCTGDSINGNQLVKFQTEGFYEITGTSTSEEGLSVQQINLTNDKYFGVAVTAGLRFTRYNIVYTGTDNQLVFGSFQDEESDRPTRLELEAPFIRQ